MLEFYCRWFSHGVIPCPRLMFGTEFSTGINWFDLVVCGVLTV